MIDTYVQRYAKAREKTVAEAEQDYIVKEVKEYYEKSEPTDVVKDKVNVGGTHGK